MPNTKFKDYSNFKVKGIPCPMSFVQGDTTYIGEGKNKDLVTIPSFYIGQYQVIQELYEEVMEKNLSINKGKNYPVTNVNWHEAKVFVKKLIDIADCPFRLPYEKEWEYAARGGIYNQEYSYSGSDNLKQVSWYCENSGEETKPVGLLLPNELGIYDMSGNTFEWCEDYHFDTRGASKMRSFFIKKIGLGKRPVGRKIRGSYYNSITNFCVPSQRTQDLPTYRSKAVGFRLVLSL